MAAGSLGTLTLDLIAKIGGFIGPMDKASRNAKKNSDDISKSLKGIATAASAVGVAAAAGFSVMVKSSLNAADELYKQSQIVGMSVEELSALTFTAGEAGVEFDLLSGSLGKFNKNIDAATKGKGAAFEAFSDLGIGLKNANGELKTTAVLFEEVAGALSQLEDGATKTALAQDLLGKSGKDLIPLLNAGAEGLRDGAEEAARLNQVMSTEGAKAAEEFNDNLSRLQKSISGIGNAAAMEAAPGLAEMTAVFADPEVQQGIAAIAGGLINIGTASVKVLAELHNFATWVGEEIAARVNGINSDDVVRLEQLLSSLEAQREKGFFTRAYNYQDDNVLEDAINKTKKQIGLLYEQQEAASLAARKSAEEAALLADLEANGYEDAFNDLNNLTAAQIEAGRIAREAAEEQEKLAAEASKNFERMRADLQKEIDLWGNKSKAVELAYDLERGLIEGLDPARQRELVALQRQVDLREWGLGLLEREASLNRELNEIIDGHVDSYNKAQKELAASSGLTEDAFERINATASDIWFNYANGAENALSGVKDMFTRTLAEMAHEAISKPILLNFQQKLSSGEGQAAASQAGQAAGAIGQGGWYAAIAVAVIAGVSEWNQTQNEKFEKMTAEFRQSSQSLGTILGEGNIKSESINAAIESLGGVAGDSLGVNHQMLSALLDIRSGIAGVAAGFARQFGIDGVGDSLSVQESGTFGLIGTAKNIGETLFRGLDPGSVMFGIDNPIDDFIVGFMDGLTDKVGKNLYSKKVKVIDSGINFVGQSLADILAGGVVDAFAYADVQTKKKTLGITTSNKVKTVSESLDEILLGQFAGVFEGAGDALDQSAAIFGIEFDNYVDSLLVDPQKLSLKNLEGADLVAEIEGFFSSTLDGWAGVLLDGTDVLKKYQEVGEGAFETMLRLAGETAAFSDAAKLLDLNFVAVGMSAVDAVQGLADAAGGFDSLSSGLSNYANKFLDDADKFENAQEKVTESFAALGLQIPKTRDEFKDLIENGVSDPELFASLLGLVDATDYYLSALDKQAKATMDAVDAGNKLSDALASFMEPFEDQIAKSGMDEFAAAIFDVNKALEDSIFRAQELGASEAQLSTIRQASLLEIQNIMQGQTDAALSDLRMAIDAEAARKSEEAGSKIEAIAAARDASIEAANSALQGRIESANAWMKTQIDHYKNQIDSLSDSVSGLRDLSSGLRNTVEDLLGVDASSADRMRELALLQLEGVIDAARSGKMPGQDDIESIIGAIGVSESSFSTLEDYAYEAARTASRVSELADLADSQATAEELIIEQLRGSQIAAGENTDRLIVRYQEEAQEQIEAINNSAQSEMDLIQKISDSEIAELEKQYTAFEQQINALRGIDTSVKTVADAIARLTELVREESVFYPRVAAQDVAGEVAKNNAELLAQITALRQESYMFNAQGRRDSEDTVTLLREIQYQGEAAA
ncbi:hypothetical protein [Cellvibrio sp. KY-GH-1]|uniref:hypothetical protein n=1 Tax=Cellvibrio sp. KY-GH-1 TaxID=2303332 RepID=UPI00124731A9|nr:hypothetical protein [Cellvibrio sp. KY-GH-1]